MNSVKTHNEIKITAKELTELAFSKSGETSIRGFAKRIGVSHTAVGNWIEGSTVPTFEQAAELATLAELPIIKTAANIRLQSIQGKKHKTLLKQLATTATLLIGAGMTCPAPSQAQSIDKNFSNEISDNAYYVRWRRWIHLLLISLKKRPTGRLLATT
ncbi:DUF3693 domain-containing protein [Xylella fastidiosa]|uniref:DUF3693 domain-containing protein n=1 Tax=Xylella fastidiosa TaxID=2371 RepID=UPI002362E649|nr:DUF3693 domain-containing protein [Xylella fastidiosa]MDD0932307.1 DUF3693 domain-containing protein [Xylella fastidiosa subsp. multiplex]